MILYGRTSWSQAFRDMVQRRLDREAAEERNWPRFAGKRVPVEHWDLWHKSRFNSQAAAELLNILRVEGQS